MGKKRRRVPRYDVLQEAELELVAGGRRPRLPVTLSNISLMGLCVMVDGDREIHIPVDSTARIYLEDRNGYSIVVPARVVWENRAGDTAGLRILVEIMDSVNREVWWSWINTLAAA